MMLLALLPGIIFDGAWETIWGTADPTWVVCDQSKLPPTRFQKRSFVFEGHKLVTNILAEQEQWHFKS